MPRLPLLKGRVIVGILEKIGWRVSRQKGSHIILTREGHLATLSVPDHKEVARGTLRALIRNADLTVDEFLLAMTDS